MNIVDSLGDEAMLKSRIKVRLAELDIQQTELADKLGVARQTLNGWVSGRVKPPLVTAFRIAKELKCKVDDLWEYKEE